MKHRNMTLFAVSCIMLFAASAGAQTEISGPQSGTLGPGTYLVTGEISVASGNSLTIEPGTTFLHNGNHQWLVSGTFSAIGTETDSIRFLRREPVSGHRWGGLHFIGGAPIANLDYCVVDYCYIDYSSSYYASVNVYNGGLGISLKHSTITNGYVGYYGGGLYAKNASVLIDSCLIAYNYQWNHSRGTAVYLVGCDDSELLNSEFGHNSCSMSGS
ncbi:MAG: hypothetical protein GQ565_04510 [Candidatus Aegiribacteria sp.]|nr:hypothetical protein [Candidatus Aegiribacteria sp.]